MSTGSIGQVARRSVFRISKLLGLFYVASMLSRGKLLILCYHGFELDGESSFRPTLFMRAETFARRLQTMSRYHCGVLGLSEAVGALRRHRLPKRAVCLTIDDGFFGVLVHAAPLLRRHGVPATLYVTSYYVAKGTPIFRLVVQYMFWKTAAPALDVTGEKWGVAETIDLADHDATEDAMWRIIEFGETHCDEHSRERISVALGDRLGVPYAALKGSRILSLLTPAELRQLDRMGVQIELHTHRHRLSTTDETEVTREVVENRQFLEEVLNRKLQHLCYPSGVWDARQWPWLASLGVATATTCNPAMNTAETPALGLYRVVDSEDLSQIEFEAEVSGFCEVIRQVRGKKKRLDSVRQLVWIMSTVGAGGAMALAPLACC